MYRNAAPAVLHLLYAHDGAVFFGVRRTSRMAIADQVDFHAGIVVLRWGAAASGDTPATAAGGPAGVRCSSDCREFATKRNQEWRGPFGIYFNPVLDSETEPTKVQYARVDSPRKLLCPDNSYAPLTASPITV